MLNIHEYNWEKYLEREQPLILFTLFNEPYGEMLRKTTGFGFSKQLHYFRNNIGVFYKLKKEITEADNYYAKLLAKNDPIISIWIQKEKETHALAKSLNVNMSLKDITAKVQEIFLFNTTIPYRLLSASIKVKTNKKVLEQIESIRLHSLYPNIIDVFLPKVLDRLSKKSGISQDLLFLCTPDELIAIDEANTKISSSILKKRAQGCYFIKDKKWQFTYSQVDKYESIRNLKEVRGSVGFKGYAKGTVKIINKPENMDKFSDGDILVSINTNPSLMPIIKKCKAIISDEGGITCHAAIVARELKIPCLIGTKYATKLLKDGDLIELDTNKGIIKILKK